MLVTSVGDNAGAESGVSDVTLTAASAVGDMVEVICNGTAYFVHGSIHAPDHGSIA